MSKKVTIYVLNSPVVIDKQPPSEETEIPESPNSRWECIDNGLYWKRSPNGDLYMEVSSLETD